MRTNTPPFGKGQRLALMDMLGWITPKGTPTTDVIVVTPNYYGRPDYVLVRVTDTNSTMHGYDIVAHVDNLTERKERVGNADRPR